MKVSILGCGPAGLVAAYAASIAGVDVTIYSKKRKSQLYGCQYLHHPIPGIMLPDPVAVRYHLIGSPLDYRRKVYGSEWDGSVSPEDYEGDHMAWDIRFLYDVLWSRFEDKIVEADVTPAWIVGDMPSADIVFNSIPKRALCVSNQHDFLSQKIWALGDAPGVQSVTTKHHSPPNSVTCYAGELIDCYRISNVFGYRTIEWPWGEQPHDKAAVVEKPLRNDCDCWPDDVLFPVGRYGMWRKGIFVHDVYKRTIDRIFA